MLDAQREVGPLRLDMTQADFVAREKLLYGFGDTEFEQFVENVAQARRDGVPVLHHQRRDFSAKMGLAPRFDVNYAATVVTLANGSTVLLVGNFPAFLAELAAHMEEHGGYHGWLLRVLVTAAEARAAGRPHLAAYIEALHRATEASVSSLGRGKKAVEFFYADGKYQVAKRGHFDSSICVSNAYTVPCSPDGTPEQRYISFGEPGHIESGQVSTANTLVLMGHTICGENAGLCGPLCKVHTIVQPEGGYPPCVAARTRYAPAEGDFGPGKHSHLTGVLFEPFSFFLPGEDRGAGNIFALREHFKPFAYALNHTWVAARMAEKTCRRSIRYGLTTPQEAHEEFRERLVPLPPLQAFGPHAPASDSVFMALLRAAVRRLETEGGGTDFPDSAVIAPRLRGVVEAVCAQLHAAEGDLDRRALIMLPRRDMLDILHVATVAHSSAWLSPQWSWHDVSLLGGLRSRLAPGS